MNNSPLKKVSCFSLNYRSPYKPVNNISEVLTYGFTLLELIIVIAIVGILAAIAFPTYHSFIEQAKTTRAIAEIGDLEKDIIAWQSDHGELPMNLEEIGKEGLLDPWGNPYQFLNFNTIQGKGKKRKDHNLVPINDDFDLYSLGKDGKSQTPLTAKASRDDIIRANNGSYIGTASGYS